MDEVEQQALEAALELFNRIRPQSIRSFHQASFRVASSHLSEQFPKFVLKNVLKIDVRPERLEEMLDKLVVNPFVQGTRLYASQTYERDFTAPAEPQVPFELIWRSYANLEQDESSEPAKLFEETCSKHKSLLPLASILAYTFAKSAVEDFPEMSGNEQKLNQVMAVYIMAGIRFEFLYLMIMPEITKAVEKLKEEEATDKILKP